MGLKIFVELVAYHTRFYPHPTLFLVELKDIVKMTADIYYNTVAYDLPGNAGTASTWYKMSSATPCFRDEFYNVVLAFGVSNTKWHLTIYRGIGSIGYTMQAIGQYFHDKMF